MATAKVKRSRVVVDTVSITYPDWYPQDNTKMGQIVDVLLEAADGVRDPTEYRLGIYSDDADRIQAIVDRLNTLYSVAHRIDGIYAKVLLVT